MAHQEHFSRRQVDLALLGFLGPVAATSARGQAESTSEAKRSREETLPRTKKDFLKLAIGDIEASAAESAKRRREMQEKGMAPLFVQLANIFPFGDWDYYFIDRDLRWAPQSGAALPSVRVPRGFVTDLASVPPYFWAIYPPTGRYAYAAVVHDYMYWTQTTTKQVADDVMYAAMRDAGTDEKAIGDFRTALTLAGGFAWSRNKTAREGGEKRVIKDLPSEADRLISWTDWKNRPGVFAD
jgi:hypothetical protein